MICPYCQNQNIFLAQSYDISQVKQRFIPTYSHTQIFAPIDTNPTVRVRCTPTFHSTILRGELHCHKKKMTNQTNYKRSHKTQQTVYKNNSRAKKQDHFYGRHRNCNYNSKQLWYDSSKQELFKQQEGCCHRHYSKDRKQMDLSSNPVFGGTTFNFSHCKQESLNPNEQAQIVNKQEQKQVEKEQQQQRNEQHKDKEIQPEQNRAIEQKGDKKQQSRQKLKKTVNKERKRICEIQANHPQKVQQASGNKATNANKTIVEGTPCFTVIRKRNW